MMSKPVLGGRAGGEREREGGGWRILCQRGCAERRHRAKGVQAISRQRDGGGGGLTGSMIMSCVECGLPTEPVSALPSNEEPGRGLPVGERGGGDKVWGLLCLGERHPSMLSELATLSVICGRGGRATWSAWRRTAAGNIHQQRSGLELHDPRAGECKRTRGVCRK
jgi:hypothetical protein